MLANDTDVDSNLLTVATPRLVSGPSNGTLTLNANGSFTYTPNGGFTGNESFTYRANDGTSDSNAATVTIAVNPSLDTTRPTVASIKPAAGQTGVSRATNITVTFSEAMSPGSLNADTVRLVKSGTTTLVPLTMTTTTDAGGRTVLKLDPFGPTTQKLGKSATYRLTVEGAADADSLAVEDTANNELAQDKLSSFKTKRR